VALTIEQFERGWDLYERTQVRVMRGELPREAPMAALEDFWSGVEAVPVTLRESWVHTRRHDRAFADRQ
jgi:hypothetical protein